MKNMKNKTTKNNMINYGIVIVLFVIVQALSSTGNLSGSISVNLFFMGGTGQTYTEPDAGSVAYGTDNIFGTIESGKKSKKSKKNKKKAAETTTEQTASDTGADGQTTDSQEGANTQDAAAAETTGQAQ